MKERELTVKTSECVKSGFDELLTLEGGSDSRCSFTSSYVAPGSDHVSFDS